MLSRNEKLRPKQRPPKQHPKNPKNPKKTSVQCVPLFLAFPHCLSPLEPKAPSGGLSADTPASAKIAALKSQEGPGSNPGSPSSFRKKTLGKAPGGAAPQPAGGGLRKEDLDKMKEELLAAFREELQSFKTQLLADIEEKLAAAQAGAEEEMYYEEEN